MAKRKRSTAAAASTAIANAASIPVGIPRTRRAEIPLPANAAKQEPEPPRRRPSRGGNPATTNPDTNPDVLDGVSALRASPDAGGGDLAGVSASANPALKPRVGKVRSTGNNICADAGALDGTAAGNNAITESITAPPAEGPENTASTEPVSETAAADLPGKPGRNKRKKTLAQHVKEDSAPNNISTVNAALGHVTPSTRDAVKVEKDVGVTIDPEIDEGPPDEIEDDDEASEALSRPPPVNSDYLPLPWKGRLGYACLNTYLRNANPPVFSSRTCRIASIIEHRHPLKDPSQPEHATKNRPDKDQPADIERGQRYVEQLGLANARDLFKMFRWNDKYGIKFMRLSSEMFPFASHHVYGYKLAPFAAETLAEVGKVVAELGHRVTTHPGQFTQLGSPRKEVIDASFRDLEYHDELLSLLKLPPQQDRDAVMILHLGGAFGDKPAALDRFRENYAKLPQSVKNRLVLENDDVVWSLHEVLPLCQELNIPCVLDFHHHNILFDSTQIREGTKDVVDLFPAILETWKRKGITPKMHYSESCPEATTARNRRKHSPRVMTLPPCPDTMDLMIEAKDKEQAVFELMRTFKLPGYDLFNDIIPHVREDENRPIKPKPKKAAKKGKKKIADDLDALDEKIEDAEEDLVPAVVLEEEIAMGGPQRRVYWPPTMEDWLRPVKRVVKKKEEGEATPAKKKRKTAAASAPPTDTVVEDEGPTPAKAPAAKRAAPATKKRAAKPPKAVPTPSPSEDDGDSSPLSDLGGDEDEDAVPKKTRVAPPAPSRKRSGRVGRVSYKEEDVADLGV